MFIKDEMEKRKNRTDRRSQVVTKIPTIATSLKKRHAVCAHRNRVSLRKACSENGLRLFVCHVEDTIRNCPLSFRERCARQQPVRRVG